MSTATAWPAFADVQTPIMRLRSGRYLAVCSHCTRRELYPNENAARHAAVAHRAKHRRGAIPGDEPDYTPGARPLL